MATDYLKKFKEKLNTFRDFKFIDEDNIDQEWLTQAGKSQQVGEALAKARRNLSILKSELDTLKATTAHNARRHPALFDLEKATDESIKEVVAMDEDVQEKTREYHNMTAYVNMLEVLQDSMIDRRKALENYVSLISIGWCGEPRSRDLSQARKNVSASVHQKVREASKNKGELDHGQN